MLVPAILTRPRKVAVVESVLKEFPPSVNEPDNAALVVSALTDVPCIVRIELRAPDAVRVVAVSALSLPAPVRAAEVLSTLLTADARLPAPRKVPCADNERLMFADNRLSVSAAPVPATVSPDVLLPTRAPVPLNAALVLSELLTFASIAP